MSSWPEDDLTKLEGNRLLGRTPKALQEDAFSKWRTFHFATRLKLQGADHFCRIAIGAASMPDDMGLPLLAHRQTEWYLDAFFFELMSAYDILLQEMNIIYRMDLSLDEVKWALIKSHLPHQIKTVMEKERETDWFKRLSWYRNTGTHRAYIPTTSGKEGFGDKTWDYEHHEVHLFYYDASTSSHSEENIQDACPDYMKRMVAHISAVWALMATEFSDDYQ